MGKFPLPAGEVLACLIDIGLSSYVQTCQGASGGADAQVLRYNYTK